MIQAWMSAEALLSFAIIAAAVYFFAILPTTRKWTA
jgi:hypothetical protein